MPDTPNIAYLTSVYARSSDLYIRGEVAQLRVLGFTVHTFSIRRPDPRELVSDEIHREHAATEFILEMGAARLVLSLDPDHLPVAWTRAGRSPARAKHRRARPEGTVLAAGLPG